MQNVKHLPQITGLGSQIMKRIKNLKKKEASLFEAYLHVFRHPSQKHIYIAILLFSSSTENLKNKNNPVNKFPSSRASIVNPADKRLSSILNDTLKVCITCSLRSASVNTETFYSKLMNSDSRHRLHTIIDLDLYTVGRD